MAVAQMRIESQEKLDAGGDQPVKMKRIQSKVFKSGSKLNLA